MRSRNGAGAREPIPSWALVQVLDPDRRDEAFTWARANGYTVMELLLARAHARNGRVER